MRKLTRVQKARITRDVERYGFNFVGRMIGVSGKTVFQWAKGKTGIGPKQVILVEDYFGSDPERVEKIYRKEMGIG